MDSASDFGNNPIQKTPEKLNKKRALESILKSSLKHHIKYFREHLVLFKINKGRKK